MNNKIKQVFRGIAGFILLPIFIAIFMCDRFILIFLFWMESKRLKIWLDNTEMFMFSLLRVVTCGVMYSIYKLIQIWLF